MFRNAPIARLVCVLFLVVTLVGLFLVVPAQAQTDNGNGNNGTNNGKDPKDVPEPMTLALLGLGLVGLTGVGLLKRK